MNTRFIRASFLIVPLIVMLTTSAFTNTPDSGAALQRRLVGAWNVEGSTVNQGTFPVLMTFNSEGSVIASESPVGFESAGHGSWTTNTRGQVSYTFYSLLGSQDGVNTGKIKVVGTLKYDPKTNGWSGPFKVEVFDAGGQLVLADEGTFKLTPIPIESLN